MTNNHSETMRCLICGIGAYGPGFTNWPELSQQLRSLTRQTDDQQTLPPKPDIIPANERRRSPLAVKLAVETSWQALQQANISSSDVACVFGSGLGDTEITDYMCRVLTTELKQLSPTKFHNSVHNAAAGYWTISTDCNKSANSIAAYHYTAGLALLEGISQSILQNVPVLITLFDTKAHSVYEDIFDCRHAFATAILVSPTSLDTGADSHPLCELSVDVKTGTDTHIPLNNSQFEELYQTNPAAKLLELLNLVAGDQKPNQSTLPLSQGTYLSISVNSLTSEKTEVSEL